MTDFVLCETLMYHHRTDPSRILVTVRRYAMPFMSMEDNDAFTAELSKWVGYNIIGMISEIEVCIRDGEPVTMDIVMFGGARHCLLPDETARVLEALRREYSFDPFGTN